MRTWKWKKKMQVQLLQKKALFLQNQLHWNFIHRSNLGGLIVDLFNFLVGGKHKPVVPRPVSNSSVDDLLNSLGCSTEFDIADCPESGRSSVGFGSFLMR